MTNAWHKFDTYGVHYISIVDARDRNYPMETERQMKSHPILHLL